MTTASTKDLSKLVFPFAGSLGATKTETGFDTASIYLTTPVFALSYQQQEKMISVENRNRMSHSLQLRKW